MKEMTLREVQLFGLEILKDVHQFCISNNIRYSLGYGTLIGAIRHKGFIPWDDDIDIIMPRPDYERFCKSYQSNIPEMKVFSPIMGNCYFNYARVCDLKRTYVHSLPWCNQSPTGLWIDIFPIDGVIITEDRNKELTILKNLNNMKLKARRPMDNFFRPMPLVRRIKTIAKKLFFKSNIKILVNEYENYIKRHDFESSEFCGMRSITNYFSKEIYPTSYFNSYDDIEFEGYKFKTISDYDGYLRTIYGDYMQLPPEEERKRHPQEMYWR